MENSVKVEFDSSPNDYDLAIVSINKSGTLGQLNTSVLEKYGYDLTEVDDIDVKDGYHLYKLSELKPVLFVVTVGDIDTKINLHENLSNGIKNNLCARRHTTPSRTCNTCARRHSIYN